jgi:predicted N-acetyltransferase YhbS
MSIIHYKPSLFSKRQSLLMQTLRAENELQRPYAIEAEYPIVLSNNHGHLSLCVINDTSNTMIAHANFWPRILLEQQSAISLPVAFIGNVATHPSEQGKGVMKQLFRHMFQMARDLGLDALFLWSDLSSFYQKLGFWSFGEEKRFYFTAEALQKYAKSAYEIKMLEPTQCTPQELSELLALRFPTSLILQRSIVEFSDLLKTPDMILLIARRDTKIIGFAFLGKGCDMLAVIHEWGCQEPEFLLCCAQWVLKHTGWTQIQLLAPAYLDAAWCSVLEEYGDFMHHPCALAKIEPHSKLNSIEKDFFIWGLDSI